MHALLASINAAAKACCVKRLIDIIPPTWLDAALHLQFNR
jgi:hypothetical protein